MSCGKGKSRSTRKSLMCILYTLFAMGGISEKQFLCSLRILFWLKPKNAGVLQSFHDEMVARWVNGVRSESSIAGVPELGVLLASRGKLPLFTIKRVGKIIDGM